MTEATGAPAGRRCEASRPWALLAGLARAAAAYGQPGAARRLWEAAGCWADALGLAALQGDFDAVRRYSEVVRLHFCCP